MCETQDKMFMHFILKFKTVVFEIVREGRGQGDSGVSTILDRIRQTQKL